MINSIKKVLTLILLSGITISTTPARAALVITGTRAVFAPGANEKVVSIRNEGDQPVLMQAWVDTGDAAQSPEMIKTPFMLLPPLSRIDPGKGQSLRILFSGGDVPEDRESVYWLNVLEIPPKVEDDMSNKLMLNFRTRIKIFYRPASLAQFTLEQSASALRWSLSGGVLTVANDGPHHITMNTIRLIGKDRQQELNGLMLSPRTKKAFPLGIDAPAVIDTIKYSYVNDFGAAVELTGTLAQPGI